MLLDVLLRFSIYTLSNYRRFSIPESNKRMPADLHCQILPHESSMQALSFGAFRNPPCTSRTSMHLATVFRLKAVARCIGVSQVHRVFPAAQKITKRTQMRHVYRSPSRASPLFLCTDDRKARQRPGHHRPCAQKTGPEVDASGPGSHLLAGDGAVQRWSTTGH